MCGGSSAGGTKPSHTQSSMYAVSKQQCRDPSILHQARPSLRPHRPFHRLHDRQVGVKRLCLVLLVVVWHNRMLPEHHDAFLRLLPSHDQPQEGGLARAWRKGTDGQFVGEERRARFVRLAARAFAILFPKLRATHHWAQQARVAPLDQWSGSGCQRAAWMSSHAGAP